MSAIWIRFHKNNNTSKFLFLYPNITKNLLKENWISKLNIKLDGNINQYKNMPYDLRFHKNIKILLWRDISNDNFIWII